MASALIERLIGWNPLGLETPPDEPINAAAFISAFVQFKYGALTVPQITTAFQLRPADISEATSLVGSTSLNLTDPVDSLALLRGLNRVRAILELAEKSRQDPSFPIPGHSTPSEIRQRLGIPVL
jgi:hypothetical protein